MIIKDRTETFPVSVDLGRPSWWESDPQGHTRREHVMWERHLIETCDIDIYVNGAWGWVTSLLDDATCSGYGGGGMKYMFWFRSEEDKERFLDLYRQRKNVSRSGHYTTHEGYYPTKEQCIRYDSAIAAWQLAHRQKND